MSEPFIPGSGNTLPDFDKAPRGRCLNPIHRQPAGWCSSCDREWDHTGYMTEGQLQESMDGQLQEWSAELEEAGRALRKAKEADPRNVVDVVEARKRRNIAREKIENLGYQWRAGGNAPTKADNL